RDAVVPRGVDRQPAPATADIEEALAGREPELAAQMIELRLLRRVDVFVAGVKITAGIDHAAVEPQRVEFVRDVVMMRNRGGVGGTAMGEAAKPGDRREHAAEPGELFGAAREIDADRENVAE